MRPIGADVLTMTDLRGVETHGVSNMMRNYVNWMQTGHSTRHRSRCIVARHAGTATIDGDRGLGVLQGTKAMQMAIDKAREIGVGVVTMRNSGHLGAVGHFAMQAAQQDMVGICLTAMSMLVLPTFGAEPRLGTNPISIAAPAEPHARTCSTTRRPRPSPATRLGLANRVGATHGAGLDRRAGRHPDHGRAPGPAGELIATPRQPAAARRHPRAGLAQGLTVWG